MKDRCGGDECLIRGARDNQVKLETGREIQLRQCNVQLAAFALPLPCAAWLFLGKESSPRGIS